MEQSSNKTKIFLLAGFLGSGKTTLLKRILSWETDLSGTVVLVNEFGTVGIDGTLLENSGLDVIELTSGCICCTLKFELVRTLKMIWNRFRPQRLLLEATGVAEPKAVVEILRQPEFAEKMVVEKIITVLDIHFWIERENFGQFFMNQVTQADLVLLNKIDTVEKAQVSLALQEIRNTIPEALVLPSLFCEIDPDTFWMGSRKRGSTVDLAVFYNPKKSETSGHTLEDAHTHDHHFEAYTDHAEAEIDYVTFGFTEKNPMNEQSFKTFMTQLPWELFRIKGPVRFINKTRLLNYVAGQSNWEAWKGASETRLAFVGWKLNAGAILEKLKECVNR